MNNNKLSGTDIKYPFLPLGKTLLYVGASNAYMKEAQDLCKNSGCVKQPTGAVIVKEHKIIGRGTNAGIKMAECARWGSPTGTNYGPCKDICRQMGHAEAMAINDAIKNGFDSRGASLYLYGHWWCCQNCWQAMIKAGIKEVYLLDESWTLFNPDINLAMKNWGKPKNR